MANGTQQQALDYERAVYVAALAYQQQHPMMPPSAPPHPAPASVAAIQAMATQQMTSLGPGLPGAPIPDAAERVRTYYGLAPNQNYAANAVAVSPNVMWAAGYQLQTNELGHQYWTSVVTNIRDTVTTLFSGDKVDTYSYWNP